MRLPLASQTAARERQPNTHLTISARRMTISSLHRCKEDLASIHRARKTSKLINTAHLRCAQGSHFERYSSSVSSARLFIFHIHGSSN